MPTTNEAIIPACARRFKNNRIHDVVPRVTEQMTPVPVSHNASFEYLEPLPFPPKREVDRPVRSQQRVTEFVLRSDSRSPAEIYREGGFKPREIVKLKELSSHSPSVHLGYGKPTMFISFSRSLDFVSTWSGSWIYLARVHHAVDVQSHLGINSQKEVMAYCHVFWEDIYGFRRSPRAAIEDEREHYYLNQQFNDEDVSSETLLRGRNLMKCGRPDLIDPDDFDVDYGSESDSESDSGWDSDFDENNY